MLQIIELFSGLGSQTQALKNIGVRHGVAAVSEIDKYADISYRALHGGVCNLGDITKIADLPNADLWTYSFPCTDISMAGAGKGLDKGGGTRSGLLWEVERLLLRAQEIENLPKYLLLENVKNLIGAKHKANFEMWLAFLSGLGYKNYYKVLNAKHYGIPQNRERLFCVSILGEHEPYEFPAAVPLELRLKDMLETIVDEKYYLSNAAVDKIVNSNFMQERRRIMTGAVSDTILARDYKDAKCVLAGILNDEKYAKMQDISRRVYDTDGIAPTIHCAQGGNLSRSKDKLPYPDKLDIPTKPSDD